MPLAVFLAMFAGASFVMQSNVNAQLRSSLNSPFWAGFVSYLGGTIVMALILVLTGSGWPKLDAVMRAPLLSWTGGIFGVIYVASLIALLPRLGTATTIALFISGQMLTSIAFDHFGLFGLPPHPVDWQRMLGAVMLIGGVILIRQ